MADYSNWDSLVEAARSKCATILKNDVAPVAKEILKKHIQSDIYGVYTPKPNGWVNGQTYQRRHILESNIVERTSKTGRGATLLVSSYAPPSPPIINGYAFTNKGGGSFLKMLEVGNMGFWRKNFPRPAVKNAQEEINNSNEIKAAIQSGINREF